MHNTYQDDYSFKYQPVKGHSDLGPCDNSEGWTTNCTFEPLMFVILRIHTKPTEKG